MAVKPPPLIEEEVQKKIFLIRFFSVNLKMTLKSCQYKQNIYIELKWTQEVGNDSFRLCI